MTGREDLQAQVVRAFRDVPGLPAEEIVRDEDRPNDDAQLVKRAFGGRRWRELSRDELMYHRETLSMFSPEGFRSYLPAYLVGALSGDSDVDGDLAWHLVAALRKDTGHRLALLDDQQRAAVIAVLRWISEAGYDDRADGILTGWR